MWMEGSGGESFDQKPKCTCTVAHSFVLDDVLVLQRLEDLDFPLKLLDVLGGALLELLHRHHLPRVVLQRVVPAHLHTAKVALMEETTRPMGGGGGVMCVSLPSTFIYKVQWKTFFQP